MLTVTPRVAPLVADAICIEGKLEYRRGFTWTRKCNCPLAHGEYKPCWVTKTPVTLARQASNNFANNSMIFGAIKGSCAAFCAYILFGCYSSLRKQNCFTNHDENKNSNNRNNDKEKENKGEQSWASGFFF